MRSFFGLDEDYMENVYQEFFALKYHGGWSFIEAYNLPVRIRTWFLRRLTEQMQKEADEIKKQQKK